MYEYVLLAPLQLTSFRLFIPEPIYRALFLKNLDYELVSYGVFFKNKPVGVCLARLNPNLHTLEFLHLEVQETHRRQGLGKSLVASIQKEAVKKEAVTLTFIYEHDSPHSVAIEKIFKANQWQGIRPFLIRAVFHLETFNAPLIHLKYRSSPDYKEFLWKDLSKSQRENLLFREKEGHFSHVFSPFQEEQNIEFLNSLGIQYHDRVVGWLITHRLDSDTIRYSSLYIEPSLKFRSHAMKLLADSINLHKKNPTKWAVIEIPYLYVHSSWIHFIKKRLLPSAVKVTHLWQGWNTLSTN